MNMFIINFLLMLLFINGFSNRTLAQEVVVEATKMNEEKIEPSRSATVIQLSQSTHSDSPSVAEVLRKVPGIEVVRQGGIGQTTSVFIRGARSEDTLVLIDGAEANDAMSPSGGFDFSTMTPENIERIEVYRGPQSVRYGSEALGGVINIVTKEGKEKFQNNYLLESGSENYGFISTSGKINNFNYAASGSYLSTEGFSVASDKLKKSESDGVNSSAGNLKLGWTPTSTAKIETTLRYINADIEIDSHGGSNGDDPNNKINSKQLLTGMTAADRFLSDQFKATLGFYFTEMKRSGRNQPDSKSLTNSSDFFLSENQKIQSEIDWLLGELHTIRFNLNYRGESGTTQSLFNGTPTFIPRQKQSVLGSAVSYLLESSSWFFDIGARSDQSSQAGSIMSYRSSLGRVFNTEQIKSYVSFGTGYKLPSLYQLYSTYGDANLNPEKSTTLEFTIEKSLTSNFHIGFTIFENKFYELIDYNMQTNRYFNLSKTRSQGFEVQTSIETQNNLQFSGSYTYLDSKDETTDLKLLRRPQNAFSFSTQWIKENYEVTSHFYYRGERDDLDPNSLLRVKMKPYTLVSLGGSYRLNKILKMNARIENLFDAQYEEVKGYNTADRSLYAGISGEFD